METENVSDRSNNISVSIGLQNVMDRYGTDQKAIRYNGNIVWETAYFMYKSQYFNQQMQWKTIHRCYSDILYENKKALKSYLWRG